MSTSDSAPDRAHRPDTLLVTLTGRERPGVTSAVFATLGRAGVEVVDLEQIVLRRRLILGLLVTAPDDVQSLRQDLQATADDLSMTLEVEPGSGDTSQPSHGRAHVTVLGTPLTAAAMAASFRGCCAVLPKGGPFGIALADSSVSSSSCSISPIMSKQRA